MEIRAQLNGVRLAPRKVRAVIDLIKKKDAVVALNQLDHYVRRPSPIIAKLLRSAIVSAENTYSMIPENLYIKDIFVNEGIKLRRFMPRAQGRATEIQKKTSTIILVLDERVAGLKQEKKKVEKKETVEQVAETKDVRQEKKHEVEREIGKKTGILEKGKRFFSRKSI